MTSGADISMGAVKDVVEKFWGYRELRSLQEPAMKAVLEARDSVLVLPTGGGKSLCYQAPAVVRGGTTVVISPLISLMKDQVDGLREMGIAAAQLDSSLSPAERRDVENATRRGEITLLFVSPERLVTSAFQTLIREANVSCFAIDEAHCISHWGHDFRPEYRQLADLRRRFSDASFHAFTATATERVRQDIVEQLGLREPEVLVGNFDRGNLTYRIIPRRKELEQVQEVLARHEGEAGIVYCIRRKDVDQLAASLREQGVKVIAYHAGMTPDQRKQAQEAFLEERADLCVATVAFGMGIDRSNIRFVVHTGMPKSIEHYQQETGRAGRDGLDAECVLLYSGQDFLTWKSLIEKSAADGGGDALHVPEAVKHLEDMDRYCRGAVCRHRALVNYFGQTFETDNCGACDLCLGDIEEIPDAVVISQKILSAVARVQERWGIGHVVSVLRGRNTERVREMGHDQLMVFGLLKDHGEAELRDFIYQLISQKALRQEGEYPVLKLTAGSWEVMKKQRPVRLVQAVSRKENTEKRRREDISWEGVDQRLFDALRAMRKEMAQEHGVPPYVVFSDATLRELARVRPATVAKMRMVYGIGEAKLKSYGEKTMEVIDACCRENDLTRDQFARPNAPMPAPRAAVKPAAMSEQKRVAFEAFKRGETIEAAAEKSGRAKSTVGEYLVEFVQTCKPASVGVWVSAEQYAKVAAALEKVGPGRLKPLFVELGEKVPYELIRVVLAHLETKSEGRA